MELFLQLFDLLVSVYSGQPYNDGTALGQTGLLFYNLLKIIWIKVINC